MKTKTTKKLFYNKWLFKVVLECAGISYLHRRGIAYIQTLEVNADNPWIRAREQSIVKNRQNLMHVASILEILLPTADHQIRVENGTCAVFTNDIDLIEKIKASLTEFVVEVHKPLNKDQEEFLLTNKNKIICDQLPHEEYQYKIYFRNGEIKDTVLLKNFVTWAEKYGDRIYIPNGARKIIDENYHYFYGQYFYAKDQKIASMALMMMGNYLNKTEEYVLKSDLI